VQLKRRYDLIPNLVETAKGYLAHESKTLEAVIAARSQAMSANRHAMQEPQNPEAVKSMFAAEAGLQGSLSRLMVVAESYPDLKANHTMATLMEELTSTENRIAFSRQAYNDAVMSYNNSRESFPTSIIAGMGGFQPATSFEIQNAAERENVKVSF
jgi:LemA protein